MLTHANFTALIATLYYNHSIIMNSDDVHLSYLPLPHLFERALVVTLSYYGAQIYIYSGDILKLMQDIVEVKPTIFGSVPRLYNRFYDKIKVYILLFCM